MASVLADTYEDLLDWLRPAVSEAGATLRLAHEAGGAWLVLTGFLALLSQTLVEHQYMLLALGALITLDSGVGAYRYWKAGEWNTRKFFGRTAAKVAGSFVLLVGAAMLAIAAPLLKDWSLSAVIGAFALKEMASIAYNAEASGLAAIPKSLKTLLNKHNHDTDDDRRSAGPSGRGDEPTKD